MTAEMQKGRIEGEPRGTALGGISPQLTINTAFEKRVNPYH
jgi:hypothetical protein